ncbi:MAG: hypothetical protein JNN28_06715 [Saprospiraceae bacterium]|nr:hypothetical protein [Saprospiraceae bacterium]
MNIIKKQGWLPLLLMGVFLTSSQAQVDPEQREARLAAFRAEVFTRVLNLTPEEAQQFWPVYNEYTDRREQIQQDLKANKQLDQMSDAEVEEQIRRHFDMKQRELELEKDAYQKLRKVLPIRKVAKLPAAEREFRESLVKKLQEARERRQERQQIRPGRNRR